MEIKWKVIGVCHADKFGRDLNHLCLGFWVMKIATLENINVIVDDLDKEEEEEHCCDVVLGALVLEQIAADVMMRKRRKKISGGLRCARDNIIIIILCLSGL